MGQGVSLGGRWLSFQGWGSDSVWQDAHPGRRWESLVRTWHREWRHIPLAGNFEAELHFLGGRVRGDMTNPVAGEPSELGVS